MHITRLISAAALLSVPIVFGPPHITVRPVSSTTAGITFELDVEYHTAPDDLTVSGRAEGVRAGHRVTLPLTISRKRLGHFAVTRQWDAGTPWVLVFAAEQGLEGSHGVAEGIVLLEANGSIRSIEYTTPGFLDGSKKPFRVTGAKIDAALKSLGLEGSSAR